MAKFGEGDPRWIVEQRADGHNLNQWHWNEKSLLPWCKKRVEEMFVGSDFAEANEGVLYKIAKLDHLKGDVTCNNRKGKRIVLYEMNMQFEWIAVSEDGDEEQAKGTFHLPYVSDENDLDEFEVKVTMSTKETNETYKIKQYARKNGIALFKKQIPIFLDELLTIHSTKHVSSNPDLQKKIEQQQKQQQQQQQQQQQSSSSSDASASTTEQPKPKPLKTHKPVLLAKTGSSNIMTRKITLNVEFYPISSNELFQCFIDQNRIRAFTGGSSIFNGKIGGEFSLFDGSVTGKVIDVKPGELIVQSWRFRDWQKDHYSRVTMQFGKISNGSSLKLVHESVPSKDIDRTRSGWINYYFDRLKGLFGYQYKIHK